MFSHLLRSVTERFFEPARYLRREKDRLQLLPLNLVVASCLFHLQVQGSAEPLFLEY